MAESLSLLSTYFMRIAPGLLLGGCFLFLLKKRELAIRIAIYISLFILIRDAMTPLELWRLGSEAGFWLRFTPNSFLLVLLGAGSLGVVLVMNYCDREAKSLLVWFRASPIIGILVGTAAAIVVVLPAVAVYRFTDLDMRGGPVPTGLLPAILTTTMLGNLYEETLFRGYLQGYLEKSFPSPWWKPAVLSGVAFGFGHSFLALTVTNVGPMLLVFATWEGVIAGLVRAKFGVIPATFAHGLAIFLLAGGFF